MEFVCGIHGVGKTCFARQMGLERALSYYSAGELINKKTEMNNSVNKKVQNIPSNQVCLLDALSEIKEKQYILDGHLCLLNGENRVERIPYDVFHRMSIDKIYIVVDFPSEIQRRLEKRDNQKWDIHFIALFQQKELGYAKWLSKKKNVPLKIIFNHKEITDCTFLEEKNIILPIKPVFADKILSGEKKYEFRKKLCSKDIDKIYIYATAPVKKIIGEVKVKNKLGMDKEALWKQTQPGAGISKEFFDAYFQKQNYACAYEIGEAMRYNVPISLESLGINYVPQSYIYVCAIGEEVLNAQP